MSLVVFPFKDEDQAIVAANLRIAAAHERVDEVWAVAAAEGATMAEVVVLADTIAATVSTPIDVFAQQRIGSFRSGKGDGMNTAIARAAERGFERIHFYDADITNFERSWIDGAEAAADRGYGVVRHRFPRAATDAMITWMITRPGLAMSFPGTVLPRLGQPLGGEILLTRTAVEELAGDDTVRARSDWGIDTVITHATALLDIGIYEHNAHDGKRHALYGSLTDIRDMVLECLDAVIHLEGTPHSDLVFAADPPGEIPDDLKEMVAYDLDATRRSIADPISSDEEAILVSLGIEGAMPAVDAGRWTSLLPRMMKGFLLTDPAWRSVVFRLWVERVIHYTTHQVPRGYDAAIAYLEDTIHDFERTQPESG